METKKFVDYIFNKYAIDETNFIDAQGLQAFLEHEQNVCNFFI